MDKELENSLECICNSHCLNRTKNCAKDSKEPTCKLSMYNIKWSNALAIAAPDDCIVICTACDNTNVFENENNNTNIRIKNPSVCLACPVSQIRDSIADFQKFGPDSHIC